MKFWPFRRDRDADLDAEIRSHLSMAERDRIDRGESQDSARAGARREFGNVGHVTETTRELSRWAWLDSVRQDLRYAIRGSLRNPSFTAIVVLTLGAAIGLNTSVFTAFNTIFLARWPVHDAARIVRLSGNSQVNVEQFAQLRQESRTLDIVGLTCEHCRVMLGDQKIRVNGVSNNFFSTLGVRMTLGRGFGVSEASSSIPAPVAILSHKVWRRDFGSNPAIVGTAISLGTASFTIIGVNGRDFTGFNLDDAPDVWVPMSAVSLLPSPETDRVLIAGRLAPGVERAKAHAELALLLPRIVPKSPYPGWPVSVGLTEARHVPMSKLQRAGILGLMTLATLLVLAIACANVSNLLLARAAARTREMAIRLSIGASRRRLLRQLLTESAVLAAGACAVGIALSFFLPQFAIGRILAASARPQSFDVRFVPDLTVIRFGCGLAAISVLAFGLAPAILASRQPIGSAVKEQGGALAAAKLAPRRVLLLLQVAVSAMLLASTGLITRSVRHAADVDLGFDLEGITEVAVVTKPGLMAPDLATRGARTLFDVITRGDMPDAAMWGQAFGWSSGGRIARVDDPAATHSASLHSVTPQFFSVMRVPLVAGRTFEGPADEIIVSESLAKSLFAAASAIGRIALFEDTPRRIVGVSKDADLVGSSFTREFTGDSVFQPLSAPTASARVLVRRDRPGQLDALAAHIARVDPRLEAFSRPLTTTRDQKMAESLVGAAIAGFVGLLAIGIATVGIAGMFAYLAQQRTREIGIRLALGARSSQILRDVFGGSAHALGWGIAIGLAGSALIAPLLEGYVHPSVGRIDFVTYTGVSAIIATAGLLAALSPARRATRIDPVQALRVD